MIYPIPKRISRILFLLFVFNRLYKMEQIPGKDDEPKNFSKILENDFDEWEEFKEILLETFPEILSEKSLITKQFLKNLWNFYIETEEIINKLRQKYQKRNDESMDLIIIAIINSAICEIIFTKNLEKNKIILSEYLKISSAFSVNSKIINKIIDSILKNDL